MRTNLSALQKPIALGNNVPSKRKIAMAIFTLLVTSNGAAFAQPAVEPIEVEIDKIVVAAADGVDVNLSRPLEIRAKTLITNGAGAVFFGDDVLGARSDRQLKNAPYIATAITEKVQVLRDGNELRQATSKRQYRDAAGRTRDETLGTNGEVTAVRINDSTENGFVYVLKPNSKTATKLSSGGSLTQMVSGLDPLIQQKVYSALGNLKSSGVDAGTTTTTGTGTLGDPKITVMRVEGASGANSLLQGKTGEALIMERTGERKFVFKHSGDGALLGSDRVKTIVLKRDGIGGMDTSNLDAQASEILAGAMRDSSFAKTAVKSSLGSRDFSGVRADGTLSTYTIPANAVGNQQPIVVSEESWTSADLKLVVYSKRSDPRQGNTIYRLENIQRVEQPLSLFTVPADYKVIEPTVSVNRTMLKK